MSAINIHGVPNASGGYSLAGKKVMVHDPVAPLESSTVLVNATDFSTAGSGSFRQIMWKESDGDLTAGVSTFTNAALIGATQLTQITVNKIVEYVDDDFTFDPVTGTIDRSPNTWFAGDKMVTSFNSA